MLLPVSSELYVRIRQRLRRLYGAEAGEPCLRRLLAMVGRYGMRAEPAAAAPARWDQRSALLIAYPDMIRRAGEAPLATLKRFADERLAGRFSIVHVLPFFPSSSDDGFAVMDYRRVDPDAGAWADLTALGEHFDLAFDLVINHVSARSAWFRDYLRGIAPARHYFIEADPAADLSAVVRPRTSPLLSRARTPYGERHVWTTFSADQVDLNFANPDVLFEFLDILLWYAAHGMRVVRLDAVAFLWKRPGTPCLHLPETHEIVRLLRDVLELTAPEVLVLTETNVPHEENVSYFGRGDEAHLVYQFSLPPLLLHGLLRGDARPLTRWAAALAPPPAGCAFLNFTASHDGVGVRPLEGLVPPEEIEALAAAVRRRGGHVSTRRRPDGGEAAYELNCTWFDALADDPDDPESRQVERFLCSQAVALALRGIPALYFHSLTATANDHEGVRTSGMPRRINRMRWDDDTLRARLDDPDTVEHRVFGALARLLEARAHHPAFHPDAPQEVLELDGRVFAFARRPPPGAGILFAFHNLSGETVELDLAALPPAARRVRRWRDLAGGAAIEGPLTRLALAPYQAVWLASARRSGGS